jgi:hypothetical protein
VERKLVELEGELALWKQVSYSACPAAFLHPFLQCKLPHRTCRLARSCACCEAQKCAARCNGRRTAAVLLACFSPARWTTRSCLVASPISRLRECWETCKPRPAGI